ncbi:MAG: NAD-dependent epimerase/dehydratase family protein [Burkholderiales bacterium]
MTRILITGAAGAIGGTLRTGLRGRYPLLRLSDMRVMAPAGPGEELVPADLRNYDAVKGAMTGIDCVVHLGGIPREAPWPAILEANIIGSYNVFEAARECGVRRVVFASSNHAVGFHRVAQTIGIDAGPRPDSRYGVSKVYGEALGRLYADKYGLSVACLRIGSFRDRPEDARQLSTWISPRDMVQLVGRCIDAPEYRYLVLYGVSANTRSRWKNPQAARIGYAPQDNAEDYAAEIAGKTAAGAAAEFHGGSFCDIELTNKINNID